MDRESLSYVPKEGEHGKLLHAHDMDRLRTLGTGETVYYRSPWGWKEIPVLTVEYIAASNTIVLNRFTDSVYINEQRLPNFLFPLRL